MRKFLPALFFAATFILGIFLFDDYGVSWDEPIQRDLGLANWNYVLHGDDSLFHLINKYHGPIVEMIEAAPEKLFHLQDEKTIFLFRHFINYFIFWLGSIFLFLLGKEMRFIKSEHDSERKSHNALLTSLLPVLLLYLTPRIFTQSLYNSKDIPLLSFFIISIFFLFRFFKKPSFTLAIVFALVSGMLFDIRVLGILIPVFAIVFFTVNLLNGNLSKSSLKFLVAYVVFFLLFSVAFYPVLWHGPIGGIQESFSTFSHYRYDDAQFFAGKLIKPQQLPWYYIPVWMGITIPLVWLLFFLLGFISVVIMKLRTLKNFFKDSWQWLVIANWLSVPWIIVLLLHSTVYDEWRHLFFIYPAFILIAVHGLMTIFTSTNIKNRFLKIALRTSCIILITAQTISILVFSWKNHPFENVYFNALAARKPQQKFDLDYWGLSYRQGLEYLVQHAKEDTIKACWQNAPGNYNLIWLPDADRKRIQETPFNSAEYFLTNFRFHPEQYTDSAWHTLRVDGFSILAIEKLQHKTISDH